MEVFPDPVKNNNRSVNGVANHRKERRHKGRIHFKLQKGEPTERDHDVDDKGDNGGKGKVMLKADRDVDDHEHPAESNGAHSRFYKVAAYRGPDVFHTQDLIGSQPISHVRHGLNALVITDDARTDEDGLAFFGLLSIHTAQLDDTAAQLMV